FVVVATPHNLHCTQTVKALDLGIHVLCEKPMSDSLSDALLMKNAAAKSGAVLSVGFMMHFNPAFIHIKQLIDDEELGNILAIQYKVGSYITLVNSRSHYQADLNGALLMDYAHQPDIVYWLTGKKPKGVYCSGVYGGNIDLSSNPNALTMVWDYEEPLVATIMLNYLQSPERNECEIVGDKGWAVYDMKSGELRIGNRENESVSSQIFEMERDSMYIEEHRVFLESMDQGRSLSSPAEEAIVSMEIIEAALKSRELNARVVIAGA
ncbi:MAG: Gfo/Idh/MocA family oxidoreductase, partial [Spirochaetales bacterium]|nr:Gfo/Idh/MocA family oxidoreductase [Spirochaetales bacterium]